MFISLALGSSEPETEIENVLGALPQNDQHLNKNDKHPEAKYLINSKMALKLHVLLIKTCKILF